MAKIRTFICIELTKDIKEKISVLQAELKSHKADIRWTRPDSIHLTIRFLGDVEESLIKDIAQNLKAAINKQKFEISVKGTGAFPNFRRPKVLWIGIFDPEGHLQQLNEIIENELAKLGFAKELRKFSPHLTIGRVKSMLNVNRIASDLQIREFDAGTFTANEVVIMQSDLKPSGPVYTPLSTLELK